MAGYFLTTVSCKKKKIKHYFRNRNDFFSSIHMLRSKNIEICCGWNQRYEKKKKNYISQKETDLEKGKKTSIVFEARILSSIKK